MNRIIYKDFLNGSVFVIYTNGSPFILFCLLLLSISLIKSIVKIYNYILFLLTQKVLPIFFCWQFEILIKLGQQFFLDIIIRKLTLPQIKEFWNPQLFLVSFKIFNKAIKSILFIEAIIIL